MTSGSRGGSLVLLGGLSGLAWAAGLRGFATELYITPSTVKAHLASLMRKLGARNRVEVAMWAHETGRL